MAMRPLSNGGRTSYCYRMRCSNTLPSTLGCRSEAGPQAKLDTGLRIPSGSFPPLTSGTQAAFFWLPAVLGLRGGKQLWAAPRLDGSVPSLPGQLGSHTKQPGARGWAPCPTQHIACRVCWSAGVWVYIAEGLATSSGSSGVFAGTNPARSWLLGSRWVTLCPWTSFYTQPEAGSVAGENSRSDRFWGLLASGPHAF